MIYTMKFSRCFRTIIRIHTVVLITVALITTLTFTIACFYDETQCIQIPLTNDIHRKQRLSPDMTVKQKVHHVSPVTLRTHKPPEDAYVDIKYDKLKRYHRKGLELRHRFNCRKLFEDDQEEQRKVADYLSMPGNNRTVVDNEEIPEILLDCQAFKTIRQYRSRPGGQQEQQFPLAFSILVHKDFEHLERLLRALYMPQHSFCIHVDKSATESLKRAVALLATCFTNVHLASSPQTVVYAHVSRLDADMVCMKDLLTVDVNWRYLINYAATEYPLQSNKDVVKILTALGGMNDIHEVYARRIPSRYTYEFEIVRGQLRATKLTLSPPPHNITVSKGQAYNTYSRAFLEWVFTDRNARDLLEWSRKTYSPDEHYWGTLNNLYHNPFLQAPGGFTGHPDKKGYLTKFILWNNKKLQCHGRTVHSICIFSAADLPTLLSQIHLAANKFDLTFDPVAYACMEELLENRTRSETPFNLKSYKDLYFLNYKPPEQNATS